MKRFLLKVFWNPFEKFCIAFPLIPLKIEEVRLNQHVTQVKISNVATRAISRLGGGYDYSTLYLIKNKLLIDTGFCWAKRSLGQYILSRGLDQTLEVTVNTHSHEDHIGNNDVIERLTNSAIYAHPKAIATIRHPRKLPWYRSFMFGTNAPSNVEAAPTQLTCDELRFEILETPGHSDDHICIFETNHRWLFSGDLYIAPDLDCQLQDVNGPKWIASLKQILKLSPRFLFDGHGFMVEGEEAVRTVLQNKLRFLENLEKKVRSELSAPKPLEEIVENVFDDRTIINLLSMNEGWLSILTDSDFSRSNLVYSFVKSHYRHRGANRVHDE